MAKTLNATFVEPCVQDGGLLSCANGNENKNDHGKGYGNGDDTNGIIKTKVGEVFDMDKMKEFHPFIVSHDEFEHRTQTRSRSRTNGSSNENDNGNGSANDSGRGNDNPNPNLVVHRLFNLPSKYSHQFSYSNFSF